MQTPTSPDRRYPRLRRYLTSLWVIFVVALAIRFGYLAYTLWDRPVLAGKHIALGYETGRIAASIAEGHGFSSPLSWDTGPTAWITPVYPYILAVIFKFFGANTLQSEIVSKVLNCILSAFACFPLAAIGRRLFGAGVGIAAAWYWSFHFRAVFFSAVWVWDTALSVLLMTLLLWATYALDDSDAPKLWAGYGGLWALGALTNASLLSVFPGFLGYAAYRARRRGASWVRLGALSLVVFGAGVSPWLIRNQLVFHRLVLFRSNFGLEFWLGNNPDVPDSWSWWLHPNDNGQEREKFGRMGEIAYMQEKQRLAFDFIKTHPADFARFFFHRFIHNWTGTWDPPADIWSRMPLTLKIVVAYDYVFSLLAFLGLFFARRRLFLQSIPFYFLLLVFPLVYYITHTSLRYRHPIDSAMSLLVVYAVAYALRSLRGGRELSEGTAAPATGFASRS